VDGISHPKRFKTSTDIHKETSKFDTLSTVVNGLSLPCGGVALTLPRDQDIDSVIANWPEEAFGKGSVPHRPGKQKTCTGYLKNVDPALSVPEVLDALDLVSEVRGERLFHKDSEVPMPVVRLHFSTSEELTEAVRRRFVLSFNGKKAFVEAQRNFKVIRCYRCHRFGHVARSCVHEEKCENCGSQDHANHKTCKDRRECANCGQSHRASSNKCPHFLEKLNSIRVQHMF
jgi:hypothetical protein